ncbi:MAG: glycosyltransferase [Lachnospiraceae bacterium]|nr:glycosyltransferase [Lachnospiraceae bacterium]
MFGSIRKTIQYYKRNGFADTWNAVRERLWQKKHLKYAYEPPTAEELAKQREKCYEKPLKISIVVPAYETPEVFLQDLLLSVVEQSYRDYELIVADASESTRVSYVVKDFQEQYPGIVYLPLEKNGGISENTNAALDAATGEYIALLDHDDILTPDALYQMREAIDHNDRPLMLYSDEDKTDRDLERFYEPNRKRDYDRELLLSNNYICHLSVFRADVIKRLRLRKEFDGAQDHDLILRACAEAEEPDREIIHVPKVLYHWRCHEESTAADPAAKSYAYEAGKRAVEASLAAEGVSAEVKASKHLGFFRVEYEDGIFRQRAGVGIVGGPVFSEEGRMAGGAMKGDGTLLFDGLPRGFSGPMNLASLRQTVEAVDLRNAKIREDLLPLYRELTGYEECCPRDADTERIRGKSLAFCNKLRAMGIDVIYDPELKAEEG